MATDVLSRDLLLKLLISSLFPFFLSSDLDWAVFEPDLLVTSSVDTYIYVWDIK